MFNWLLFLAFYLPFQLAINPSEGIDLASGRVLIILLFFVWAAKSLKDKRFFIETNFRNVALGSFLFLTAFSALVARNMDWSERKLVFLLSVFPLYLVVSSLANSRRKIIQLSKSLVWGGLVAAILGIAQFFLQFIIGLEATYQLWANYVIEPFLGRSFSESVLRNPSWLVGISGHTFLRATATFPDPHIFSFFLGLLFPLAAGIFLETKNKFYLFCAAMLFLADILTFSRGGYLGIFGGAVFLAVIFWNKILSKYKAVVLGLFLLAFLVLIFPSPVSSRFFSSFDLREGSNSGRILMWRKAADVILENPLLGVGIGNYPLEVKATADYRDPIYAHNLYLDIAAESGVLAALFWAAFLVFLVKDFLEKAKKEPFFIFMAFSVVIFASHSLVEMPLYSVVVLPTFLILASFSNK